MITQTILEVKRIHENHKLDILIKKAVEDELHREKSSGGKSEYMNPATFRLGIGFMKQNMVIRFVEPTNYSPI